MCVHACINFALYAFVYVAEEGYHACIQATTLYGEVRYVVATIFIEGL